MTKDEKEERIIINRSGRPTYPDQKSVLTSGATPYNYTMQFNYGANVAQSTPIGFVAGTTVTNPNLLNSITISYQGAVVKTYSLTYQQSPTTSRDELIEVQECAGSGTGNCLGPTSINYQNGEVGVASSPVTFATNASNVLGIYDFNGDGLDDVLYEDSSSNLYVAFGTPTGFGSPVATGINIGVPDPHDPGSTAPLYVVGDVHGSGYASILTVIDGYWWEYAWSSSQSAFVGTNTNLAIDPSTETFVGLTDVNGDGLLDLVTGYVNNTALTLYTRLNSTTPGGALSFADTRTTAYTTTGCPSGDNKCNVQILTHTTNRSSRPLDFNGDGLDDKRWRRFFGHGYKWISVRA